MLEVAIAAFYIAMGERSCDYYNKLADEPKTRNPTMQRSRRKTLKRQKPKTRKVPEMRNLKQAETAAEAQ